MVALAPRKCYLLRSLVPWVVPSLGQWGLERWLAEARLPSV